MLRLLRRPKARPIPHSLFRTQLRLECLEGRELPSVAPVLPGAGSHLSSLQAPVNAPQILSFIATQIGAQTWVFSGTVSSPDLMSTTVQLGGLSSLGGVSCGVQANGAFSVTVTLQSGEYGTASAQATDNTSGLASALAYCMVNPMSGGSGGSGGGNWGHQYD
jgi:hypothetical protein